MADSIEKLTSKQLMDLLYSEIQAVVEKGGNDEFMFSYFLPAIPFGPDLAAFMRIGDKAKPVDNTDAEGKELFDANDLWRSAVGFAALVDGVPTLGAPIQKTAEDSRDEVDLTALVSSGLKVSQIYESVLLNCRVVDNQISDADQKRLDKARALLFREPATAPDIVEADEASGNPEDLLAAAAQPSEEIDLASILEDGADLGDVVSDPNQISQPTPIMQLYEALRAKHELVELAALDQIAKISPNDPNGPKRASLLRKRIKQSLARWESQGRKSQVESVIARIETLSRMGMPKYLSNLKERFEGNRIDAALVATEAGISLQSESALYTALRPNGVLDTKGVAVTITNTSKAFKALKKSQSKSGSAGLAVPSFGLFGSAKGGKGKETFEREFLSDTFTISFEIVQGIIDRPWLDLGFLQSRAYTTFEPDSGESLDPVLAIANLSDGKKPPADGLLRAIPTTAYFVKNLKLRSSAIKSMARREELTSSAKGGIRFMGFGGGGKKTGKTVRVNTSRAETEGEITMEGTFLIAMASVFLKKAPNPDFEAFPKPEDWV
ncbi:MAG: hypothetical protein AAF229_04625 [Pseudomonadota bacterium]